MNYSIISVQAVQRFFAVLAILAIVFGPMSNVQFAQAVVINDHQIRICHATGGDTYSAPSPTKDQIFGEMESDDANAHGSFVAGVHPDDIIPPFVAGSQGANEWGDYPGKNWDAEGQAIWNNNCVDSTVSVTYVDLAITKTVDIASPETGDVLTYTITVTNNGTEEATDVLVSDTLETGLTFVSSNPVPSNMSPLQWNLGEIATGTSGVITVDVEVATGTEGLTLTNEVEVTSEEEDNDTDDNSSSVDVEVVTPISGCTDRTALNWDDSATVDDGSCEYMCVYSDTTTTIDGNPAVITWEHGNWTDEFTSGEWIWDAFDVTTPNPQTLTFTKSFFSDNAATGTLKIAVDNFYTATLNGDSVSCSGTTGDNHTVADSCEVSVDAGFNTLIIVATNGTGPVDPKSNPAGVAFELTTVDSQCTPAEENPGSITIVKEFAGEVEPADWSFEFEGDLGQGGFTLSDETPSRTFENLGEEEYLINEIIPTGWAAPVVECTDGSGAGQGEDQLVVVLGEGEDVTCTFTNRELPPEPAQCISEANLLSNGSFESPTVTANGGQWENFAAVTGWTLLADGLELWNGLFGGANDGSQNAELDGNAAAATAISQVVATVVGNDYKLTYDFAARPNTNLATNELDVVIDGLVVDTVTADGTGDGSIDWGTYTYEFTAATTSTLVEFRDAGTDDGYGTLLDGAELCLTEDNSDGGEPQTGVLQIIKIINGSEVNASNFSFDVDKTGTDVGDLVDVAFETDGSNAYDYTTGVFTVTENAAEGYTTTYSNSMDADANCELLLVTPNATTTCTITNTFDEDGGNGEDDTYRVFGQVWHDENENDERDFFEDESSEDILEGWLITITNNDEFIATTTSDEYGNYEFEVPAGEYVITQTMQEGWALTFPNDGYWEVCVPIACEAEVTFFESILNAVIPTAYAAVAANNGPLNFGNVRTTPNYSQGSYGGGNGNGRNISLRDDDDDDDTDEPEGQVLGEATSTMPVGAPNTGAGGASALSFSLHGVLAILASRKGVQVSNGK
jgi:uncharacterized repeat protein (TIGR01451 family)